MYRHIFFDLDHTLWDFETNARAVMRRLYDEFRLEQRGITDFDFFYTVYSANNEKLWARFRNGFMRRDEFRWKRMWHTLQECKLHDTKIANEMGSAYLELLPQQTCLMPDAVETIAWCAERYDLHIISNGFEMTQRRKLQVCDLTRFFKQIITSESAQSVKPLRPIFDFAMKSAGAANAAECVMVGDSPEADVAGALNAGWTAVFYNPLGRKTDLVPTHEIASLKELMQIL